MKNYPLLHFRPMAYCLLSLILFSCSPVMDMEASAPQTQPNVNLFQNGEVNLDPGEDLVAYTWNGEGFEEMHFPLHQADALAAFATLVEFDTPWEAMRTTLEEGNLHFVDLSSENSYVHDLSIYPRFYLANRNGRRKVYIPCRNGTLLTQAFGSGNTLHFTGINASSQRNITDEGGGITTILIATDISDESQFFFPVWNPQSLSGMFPIAERQPSGNIGTGDCYSHTVLIGEVTDTQVDLALCGNYLYLIGTNADGASSCQVTIDLYNSCSFCLVREHVIGPGGQPMERIMAFAKSSCSTTLMALCGIPIEMEQH